MYGPYASNPRLIVICLRFLRKESIISIGYIINIILPSRTYLDIDSSKIRIFKTYSSEASIKADQDKLAETQEHFLFVK